MARLADALAESTICALRLKGEAMNAPLARLHDPIYAAIRIVAGLLFMMNGAQKLFGAFGGRQVADLASMQGAAGIIEFGAGLLIMVGLWAGIAAFVASGEMAFAYFIVHAPQGSWPIQNNGQLSVLFCFIFLYVATRGSGVLSVDGLLVGRAVARVQAT
jgi:putative oxidoreductase